MIDVSTGEIRIGSSVISPKNSKEDFLNSGLANEIERPSSNGNRYVYRLKPQVLYGLPFGISLYFDKSSRLTLINLGHHAPEIYGITWDDYSVEKELRRKQVHDGWLHANLGVSSYSYDWGAIYSVFDAKSGVSYITILYKYQD